jgi:uncharacterized protein YjbI with pentapeptide repeats
MNVCDFRLLLTYNNGPQRTYEKAILSLSNEEFFNKGRWPELKLPPINFKSAFFRQVWIEEWNFKNANFSGAFFAGSKIYGRTPGSRANADFEIANFTFSVFKDTALNYISFKNAKFTRTKLVNVDYISLLLEDTPLAEYTNRLGKWRVKALGENPCLPKKSG